MFLRSTRWQKVRISDMLPQLRSNKWIICAPKKRERSKERCKREREKDLKDQNKITKTQCYKSAVKGKGELYTVCKLQYDILQYSRVRRCLLFKDTLNGEFTLPYMITLPSFVLTSPPPLQKLFDIANVKGSSHLAFCYFSQIPWLPSS